MPGAGGFYVTNAYWTPITNILELITTNTGTVGVVGITGARVLVAQTDNKVYRVLQV